MPFFAEFSVRKALRYPGYSSAWYKTPIKSESHWMYTLHDDVTLTSVILPNKTCEGDCNGHKTRAHWKPV